MEPMNKHDNKEEMIENEEQLQEDSKRNGFGDEIRKFGEAESDQIKEVSIKKEEEKSQDQIYSSLMESISSFCYNLTYEQIPASVIHEAKLQFKNIVASLFSGAYSKYVRTIIQALSNMKDENPHLASNAYPDAQKFNISKAAFINAISCSIYDYSDYLFTGQTGQSAVLIPLALSDIKEINGKEFLTAQIAANEIGGRIAASTLIGPLSWQLSGYVHLVGGVVAAAKFLKLDKDKIIHAISLAMYQPNYPLLPGFASGSARIFTSASPIRTAVESAFFAQTGLKGADNIIDDEGGFWDTFSFVPIPEIFTGFNRTWITQTLSYKIYPGCSYFSTIIDSIIKLSNEYDFVPEEIENIHIEANSFAYQLENIAQTYYQYKNKEIIPFYFNLPLNVALAFIYRKVTPKIIEEHSAHDIIQTLSKKVTVSHNLDFTKRSIAQSYILDFQEILKRIPKKQIKEGFGLDYKLHNITGLIKGIFSRGEAYKKLGPLMKSYAGVMNLEQTGLDDYKISLPSSVAIKLKGGQIFEETKEFPLAGAGSPIEEKNKLVKDKFFNALGNYIEEKKIAAINDLIDDFENLDARDLERLKDLLII